jgi:hypothetical protein
MKRNQVLCGLGTLILALTPAAQATLLSPPLANLDSGGFAVPLRDNTTAPDHNRSKPIGTPFAGTSVGTLSATSSGHDLTGSFTSEVYEEASGTLDFYYQIPSAPTSTASLEVLNAWDFLTPSAASLNGVNAGEEPLTGAVAFNWGGLPLAGGTTGKTSLVFVISTEGALFSLGEAPLDGTGEVSETVRASQPMAVHEPVSLVLLGTTLALTALFIRRRHVAKVSKAEIKS